MWKTCAQSGQCPFKGTRSRFCACVSFSSVMANSEVVCCLQMLNLFITKGCNTVMTCLQSVTQCDPPSVDFLLNWHRLTRPFTSEMSSRALGSSIIASFYVFGLRCHCCCYRDNQTSASRATVICLRTSERHNLQSGNWSSKHVIMGL